MKNHAECEVNPTRATRAFFIMNLCVLEENPIQYVETHLCRTEQINVFVFCIITSLTFLVVVERTIEFEHV